MKVLAPKFTTFFTQCVLRFTKRFANNNSEKEMFAIAMVVINA